MEGAGPGRGQGSRGPSINVGLIRVLAGPGYCLSWGVINTGTRLERAEEEVAWEQAGCTSVGQGRAGAIHHSERCRIQAKEIGTLEGGGGQSRPAGLPGAKLWFYFRSRTACSSLHPNF